MSIKDRIKALEAAQGRRNTFWNGVLIDGDLRPAGHEETPCILVSRPLGLEAWECAAVNQQYALIEQSRLLAPPPSDAKSNRIPTFDMTPAPKRRFH